VNKGTITYGKGWTKPKREVYFEEICIYMNTSQGNVSIRQLVCNKWVWQDDIRYPSPRYTMYNSITNISAKWRMPCSGMLCHVALVRTKVLEERRASIIRVIRISELGTMLAVTSNWCTLWRNTKPPDSIISQKTAFFIVTAVKNSNLTSQQGVRFVCNMKDHETMDDHRLQR
jgi:hypothetical protein